LIEVKDAPACRTLNVACVADGTFQNSLKNGGNAMESGMKLVRGAAFVVVATGAWIIADASPISAQTSGADAIKTLDTDNDGTVDLAECKAAGAATFARLDADGSATLDQQELGDRAVVGIIEGPIRRMFFETRPSKDDFLRMLTKQFDLADYPDHEGKLDAKELDSPEGQKLLKLLL
jgi:hypothetical protein